MRNGYIIDVLNSVNIQESIKIGGKEIEIYEGVVYGENFRVSPFKKVTDNFSKYDENIKMKIIMVCNF